MILKTDHISPKKKPKEERSAIQKAKQTSVQNRLAILAFFALFQQVRSVLRNLTASLSLLFPPLSTILTR